MVSSILHLVAYRVEHLENLRLVFASPGLAIVPVYHLESRLSASIRGQWNRVSTYHRPDKVVRALLKLPQCFCLVGGTANNSWDTLRARILEDCLQLFRSRRVFGNLKLKLGPSRLVLSRCLCCSSWSLLKNSSQPDRRRRAGLVEEGDDVERFMLPKLINLMFSFTFSNSPTESSTYKTKHLCDYSCPHRAHMWV